MMNWGAELINRYKGQTHWLDRLETEEHIREYLNRSGSLPAHHAYVQDILANKPDVYRTFHFEMLDLFVENVAALKCMGQFDGPIKDASKETYYAHATDMQFSSVFQEQLIDGFRHIPSVPVRGWAHNKHNLYEQEGYLHDFKSCFAYTYDGRNALNIHGTEIQHVIQPEKNDKPDHETFITYASYADNKIKIRHYMTLSGSLEKQQENLQPLLKKAQLTLNERKELRKTSRKNWFAVWDEQQHTAGVFYAPMLAERQTASGTMGHELIHATLDKLIVLYRESAAKAMTYFSFGKQDYELCTTSRALYVHPDENHNRYSINAEEVIANAVKPAIARGFRPDKSEIAP